MGWLGLSPEAFAWRQRQAEAAAALISREIAAVTVTEMVRVIRACSLRRCMRRSAALRLSISAAEYRRFVPELDARCRGVFRSVG